MKLEIGIMAGAESKQFLVDLTKQIDRLEKLSAGKEVISGPAKQEALDEEEDDFVPQPSKKTPSFDDDEEDDFAPKTTKKPPASFDDDEDEESPKKKTKPKKLTFEEVNAACRKKALSEGKGGREKVQAILKKKFKTVSLSELTEDQWPACIAAMEV